MYKNFGNLVNGSIRKAPNNVRMEDGRTVTNPSDETLLELGYKRIVDASMPEPETGYYWISSWEESDTEITKVWNKVEAPEPPEPPVIEDPVDPNEMAQALMILCGSTE